MTWPPEGGVMAHHFAATLDDGWPMGGPYGLDPTSPVGHAPTPVQVIQNVEPRKLSASQVDLFQQCQRKWAFRYLEHHHAYHGSAALGDRTHHILEAYQKDGTDPDMAESFFVGHRYKRNPDGSPELTQYWPGQIAQSGFHLLPAPGIVTVEASFKCQTAGGLWTGRKDGRYVRGAAGNAYPIPADPQELLQLLAAVQGLLVVQDHKTTSDRKYALTEDTGEPDPKEGDRRLLMNLQANLYMWDEMTRYGLEWVGGEWVYYLTSGKKREAWAVRQLFHRPMVQAFIEHVADPSAHQIHHLYHIRPKALELPPSPKSCEAYGGCPHRETCNLSATERITALMTTESIKDLLARKTREREALASGAVPPLVAPPAPQQAQPAYVPPAPQQGQQAPPLPPHIAAAVGQPQQGYAPPAQAYAPPAQLPPAPSYWAPGMAMNPAQEYMRGSGKPWSVVASAADNPPPDDVRVTYDHLYGPDGVPLQQAPVERVHINPPEAPATAPAAPHQMPPPPQSAPQQGVVDDLTGMDRERLKALAMGMGLVDGSSRLREQALMDMIRKARQGGQVGTMPSGAPVQQAPMAGYVPQGGPTPASVPVMANHTMVTPQGPVHVHIPAPTSGAQAAQDQDDVIMEERRQLRNAAALAALPAAMALLGENADADTHVEYAVMVADALVTKLYG